MRPTETTPGVPCWVELGTSDVSKSAEFYAALFGWTVTTDPRPEAGGYTLASLDGDPVAALSPLYAPGQPVAWSISFAVLDADATAARAPGAHGTVVMAPTDIFDLGRFAVLRDPAGAMFTIWQARTFHGLGRWDEPNTPAWVELATRDVPAANAFYQALLGWSISDDDYPLVSVGDRRFGGIRDLNAPGVPEDVPPHWLLYFRTRDVAEAVRRAAELGGQTLAGPSHLPGGGRVATLRGPLGAVFAVYEAED